ncbi:MAG: putative toxin-antitoxin system toxin component, PIN family [Candidatus Latescibacteria bacterium 4484_107]|nr:MAG: putative toxin-antitoxin system toxin component, PIN family [Candidatus Latescibacteria bacterium 4484_107]
MRVVADTNTVISGLLWHGAPRQVSDAARDDIIELFTSTMLLAESDDVLHRGKFAGRLALVNVLPHELVFGYASLSTIVEPAVIRPAVLADPDDDAVLACASSVQAEVVVSGDSHLLELKEYKDIPILTAAELVTRISV